MILRLELFTSEFKVVYVSRSVSAQVMLSLLKILNQLT